MLAVVTGAAGHVGTNLAVALLADGHAVRAVDVREPFTAIRFGAEWIRADVLDAAAMRRACTGVELVYHLAAVISVVGGLGGLVNSVNVDGVRVVAEAARQAGVRRLVHCSSVHAFDLGACVGHPVNEASPRSLSRRLPAYDRSKAAGEVELLRTVDRGLDAVSVNPTGIIGPVDESPSRMGSVLLALWRRRMPALVDGGFDWIDVRDVVCALRAAAHRGRTGESYLVGGHRLSVAELAQAAGVASQAAVVGRVAPMWSVRAVAPVAQLLARRVGLSLLPTREAMHALESFPLVDSRKAADELGHVPRPMADTLAALYAHFVDTGRLSSATGS
jgi:nucleoside-diphosphate-sugar epimerase